MDFDFESGTNKPSAVASHLEKGAHGEGGLSHSPVGRDSPLQTADKFQKSTSGSGSTDDFEHVDHDPFMSDAGFTSSTVGFGNSARGGGDGGHLLDDFLGSTQSQFDNFKKDVGNEFSHVIGGAKDMTSDFMSSLDDKISMTKDFMSMERGGFAPQPQKKQSPPAPISPVMKAAPEKPAVQQSLFDLDPEMPAPFKEAKPAPASVFEQKSTALPTKEDKPSYEQPAQDSFSLFDSPVKKISKEDNEKFISSEDLLGDFSDARRTPEPALPASSKPGPVAPSAPVMPVTNIFPEPVAAPAAIIPPQPKDEPKLPEPALAPKIVPKPEEKSFTATSSKPTIPETSKSADAAKPSTSPAATAPAKKIPMISAEEIFYKYGLDAWFKPDRLHPVVESLIYWRDVKKSGIVFGAGLVTLLAISCFSVISVIAYLSLISLAGTIAFRIYKNVLGAIQKTSEGHPFKECLEYDLTISQEKAQNVVSVVVAHLNGFTSELRRLFLVDDLVDSIKFGVILWVLTYIGAWFNGMTLVILAFVALFTLPKVYENNKQSIDTYLDLVRSKIVEITDKVKAAIPIGKKPETDKDK